MDEIKRQDLPTGLWVVATPIGNLSDFSERGKCALELADGILCEDTRRTAKLLNALNINRKGLERLDAHSGPAKIASVVQRLSEGESLALVSDAGTPAISDPGAPLVRAAIAEGIRIVPVPGPSAVTALLSISGLSHTAFMFRGFFPRKNKEQEEELALVSSFNTSDTKESLYVWFESPERITQTLGIVAELAVDAIVVAGKELTKFHERIFSGTAAEVASQVREEVEREGALGEWCFAVFFKKSDQSLTAGDENLMLSKTLQCLLAAKIAPSEAAKQVSRHFGVSRNLVYKMVLEITGNIFPN